MKERRRVTCKTAVACYLGNRANSSKLIAVEVSDEEDYESITRRLLVEWAYFQWLKTVVEFVSAFA